LRKNFYKILMILPLVLIAACDADLFKSEDETQAPNVGDIETTAADFTLSVGDTARFWVSASDPDGKALTYKWEKTGGEFVTTFDAPEVIWRAPLKGGDYSISIRVANEDKQVNKSKLVRVISSEKPVIRIIKPLNNEYLVQYGSYNVQVEAFHDNGISIVKLYVNDLFVGNLDEKTASIFYYQWYVDADAGVAQLKVLAEARSVGTLNEDSTTVKIEGVIPGKK